MFTSRNLLKKEDVRVGWIKVLGVFCPGKVLGVGNVIELRRSGNLQVSITMTKCINGRLKPFRYILLVWIELVNSP